MTRPAVTLHLGDCLDVLRQMPEASVDAVVTDPPYGLSFMSKRWDYDVPSVEVWAECLRVLKPGGHLLAFAGTRTQHRMAVRIEDAGFEIRDMIAWVYGSGFPKSLDVSKALDKVNGDTGRLHRFTAWMRTTGLTAAQINEATDTLMGSHYLTDKTQPAIPTVALWEKLRPLCRDVPAWIDELVERIEAEREVVGQRVAQDFGEDWPVAIAAQGKTSTARVVIDITAPATDVARQWAGWGTALKPALEPITVARRPLAGTVAANVIAYGTGAINVDGCRVGDDLVVSRKGLGENARLNDDNWRGVGVRLAPTTSVGRWPSNLIHDGGPEVLDLLGDAARFFYTPKASRADRDEGLEAFAARTAAETVERAEGSAGLSSPRAGAGRTSGARNHHPTVKPVELMRYLVRLVTPPGGRVLDPFAGSGSTGKAAVLEGFRFVGIERDPEYVAIAEARCRWAVAAREAIEEPPLLRLIHDA